jgi:mercuric ion transport protein
VPTVEFIYDVDCPNVEKARQQLQRAFDETNMDPVWQEWDRDTGEAPEYVRGYGSPTILVDGQDVAGLPPSADANCCRVYEASEKEEPGVPPLELITAALLEAKEMG